MGMRKAETDKEEIGFPEKVPSISYLRIFVDSKFCEFYTSLRLAAHR
jgi:hypothetical protein